MSTASMAQETTRYRYDFTPLGARLGCIAPDSRWRLIKREFAAVTAWRANEPASAFAISYERQLGDLFQALGPSPKTTAEELGPNGLLQRVTRTHHIDREDVFREPIIDPKDDPRALNLETERLLRENEQNYSDFPGDVVRVYRARIDAVANLCGITLATANEQSLLIRLLSERKTSLRNVLRAISVVEIENALSDWDVEMRKRYIEKRKAVPAAQKSFPQQTARVIMLAAERIRRKSVLAEIPEFQRVLKVRTVTRGELRILRENGMDLASPKVVPEKSFEKREWHFSR